MKGLITLVRNWILRALIPFRKLTYLPPKMSTLKYINPHKESEKGIITFPSPIHSLCCR
jgi:hypothetical protein